MTFTYTAQPTGTSIISLADMKEWLRVDHSDEDTTITAIIDSAVQTIQGYTGLHFKATTFLATQDFFYSANFPYQVSTVTSVTYLDRAGDTQTLDTSKYFIDTVRQPGRIKFKNTPDLEEDVYNAVQIVGTCGTNGPPAPLVHAVKMLAAHFYENRRAVIVGTISSEIPYGIKAIINPYRIISLK